VLEPGGSYVSNVVAVHATTSPLLLLLTVQCSAQYADACNGQCTSACRKLTEQCTVLSSSSSSGGMVQQLCGVHGLLVTAVTSQQHVMLRPVHALCMLVHAGTMTIEGSQYVPIWLIAF